MTERVRDLTLVSRPTLASHPQVLYYVLQTQKLKPACDSGVSVHFVIQFILSIKSVTWDISQRNKVSV